MNIRTVILILAVMILTGLVSGVQLDRADGITSLKALASETSDGPPASWNSGPEMMQDDGEAVDGDDDTDEGDEGEEGDEDADDEEGDEAEEDGEGDEAVEEETPGGMSDVLGQPAGQVDSDQQNLENALAGIEDYEVSYDTTLSREELTPRELRALGVTFAGEESPIAQRAEALREFDLIETLAGRYEVVEEEFAADPDMDFAPEDSDHTYNYFQPRGDPFVVPSLIPEELRPELAGTGLEGAVDPELLEKLRWAEYEANLRFIPIIVIGVMEAGPTRIVLFTIAGYGRTMSLNEGQSTCMYYPGMPPFSIRATHVAEDSVTLTLRGHFDWRCRYPATDPVPRTFHINQ